MAIALAACSKHDKATPVGGAPSGITLARAFPNLSFSHPVLMLQAPGDASRVFVVEQAGTVRVFPNSDSATASTVFINISDRVDSSAPEAGLLGMAFDPDFASNGRVFLSYTRSGPDSTTPLVSVIARYTSSDGGATLDPNSEVVLLTQDQPFVNHNGGHIIFGPDGYLYMGLGDGGSGGDPQDNAQNTNTLLGKLLRIDVRGNTAPYGIPADNPFAASGGRKEIYAYGLRNPWRFQFDRATGELWLADVGQDRWEEVNRVTRGGNYGWDDREGAHCFEPASSCRTSGLIEPVAEYGHDNGRCSITGGYVYRGSAHAALAGMYLYGDFCTGEIWGLPAGGGAPALLFAGGISISSFGEDNAGEVYVVSYGDGTLRRIAGATGGVGP
jgi:glucose/arabinose dehydrogenase